MRTSSRPRVRDGDIDDREDLGSAVRGRDYDWWHS